VGSLAGMNLGDVIAGCAPGTSECANQTPYPGIDAWFVLLVLAVVLLAVVVGAVLITRRRSGRRPEILSPAGDTPARA